MFSIPHPTISGYEKRKGRITETFEPRPAECAVMGG
jgi:hypothetical protein